MVADRRTKGLMAYGGQSSTLQTWLAEDYPSTYIDGRRCSQIGYLQCKLILKPDRFTSAHVFKEFAALVQRAAEKTGIGFQPTPKSLQRPEVREVLFLDTDAYHLYNNAFIMRRRIPYQDGFPIDDPEIVFKYRSDNMERPRRSTCVRTSTGSTRSSSSSRSCRS